MKVLYLGLMTGDNGFTKAFRNNCSDYYEINCGVKLFNEEVKTVANEHNPDLVFIQIQTPNIITEKTVKTLKKCGAFVINWTGDVRSPIPQWYYDIGKHIDLTCFSNMTDVREFRTVGLKSEYLEIGYDPEIYKPEGNIIETKEIIFMGNNYGADFFPLSKMRIEMIDFLKNTYPDRFAVYGNGWSNCSGNFNNSQKDEAAVYRGCKLAINLSHFDYERYNSDRILRIMGSGAMCLTKNYKGIKKDYTNGVNLVVWNDFDELKILIDNYLDNEYLRKKIAKKGNKLVDQKFTFDKMCKNIIKLAE